MTIAIWVAVVLLFVVWRLRRRARQDRLAGLTGEAPTFTVTPPRRRLHDLNKEAL